MPLCARSFASSSLIGWIITSTTVVLHSTYGLQVNPPPHHDTSSSPPTFRKSRGSIGLVQRLPTRLLLLQGGGGGGSEEVGGTRYVIRQRKKGSGVSGSARSQSRSNHNRLSHTPPAVTTKVMIATTPDNTDDAPQTTSCRRRTIMIGRSVIGVLTVAVILHYRSTWAPYFNKEAIQEKTLFLLRGLRNGEDAADAPASWQALASYAMGMMLWEAAGLSTIPVETAAGMVFRFREAALSSIVGKVLGATLAFLAGRTVLSSSLEKNKTISTSQLFVLLRSRNTHSPLLTAGLLKCSILPELIKNLGSAVLPQIKLWMFMAATLLHGGGFSLMWTWLGTCMRLKETSRAMQATLTIGMFIGCVLTPVTMAWWIRALQAMSGEEPTTTSAAAKGKGTLSVTQRLDAYLIRPTSLAEIWIGGLCVASIAAVVLTRNIVV
jgi:uncharacterized membrane protein YdjX (TVP38/TMEM64 family)